MQTVLRSDSFSSKLLTSTTALAHSRSSSKQTSCASGSVKLSCFCHHLLHLVWLNLNDLSELYMSREKAFFFFFFITVKSVTTVHGKIFFFFFSVQLSLIKDLFESCVNSVSFLDCWERTHYLMALCHIFKKKKKE